MPRLSVRLLGGFEVAVDDRLIDGFESGSARALLARVAAEPGRPLSRAMLAELLWPDRPAGAAAGNLRHSLSTLRRVLGDVDPERPMLVASRTDITFHDDDDVWVDLTDFERLASFGPLEPGAVASWEAAVMLRRGSFLAGFDVQLSEAWDTWMLTMRSSVDETTARTLRRLAELRQRTGERRLAIDHVRHWIGLDPWNEQARRSLVRLLALEDQRGAALIHADELAATLGAELGIAPSPATQAVIDDVRAGRFPERAPHVPELPPCPIDSALRQPCVGRSEELQQLLGHLDDAQMGSGQVVFVIGQPGSGKSVLLRTFEREALDAIPDLVIVRGSCNAHRGPGEPFLPFRQILGQLLGDVELEWLKGRLTPSEATSLWEGLPAAVGILLDHGPYARHGRWCRGTRSTVRARVSRPPTHSSASGGVDRDTTTTRRPDSAPAAARRAMHSSADRPRRTASDAGHHRRPPVGRHWHARRHGQPRGQKRWSANADGRSPSAWRDRA